MQLSSQLKSNSFNPIAFDDNFFGIKPLNPYVEFLRINKFIFMKRY